MSLHHLPALEALPLDDTTVVIADRALPRSVLAPLARTSHSALLVESGESLKSLRAIEALAEAVLARRATRPLTLVAVGGGSLGDAVGFLASVLWRGVELWHVPTTLVAMVDSAHGGKTAVNLGAFKNQLGTFYPASRVYIVASVLETLPVAMRAEGLAELVKGLWLGAPERLGRLDDGAVGELAWAPFDDVRGPLLELLDRAIAVKLDIVAQDPREERGLRTVLNLGHTVAHALELTCGISHGHAVAWGLAATARLSGCERLFAHVHPLLRHDARVLAFEDFERFEAVLGRDKKRASGRLRSVLLEAPGRPVVTTDVTARDWFEAFRAAVAAWRERPITVSLARPRAATIALEASKSELNRLLAIACLRPGPTTVEGVSRCDDVEAMRRVVDAFATVDDESGALDCGPIACGTGGTTFRFALAIAASRTGATTTLYADDALLARPHTPLVRALEAAGATIEPAADGRGRGFRVTGWRVAPDVLEVRVDQSSQYASALALIAARGHALTLAFVGSDGRPAKLSSMVSRPYFEMTLHALARAGVAIERTDAAVHLTPTPRLHESLTLTAHADASSAAVWSAARFVCAALEAQSEEPTRGVESSGAQTPDVPGGGHDGGHDDLQPDRRVDRLLAQIAAAGARPERPLVLDVSHTPDLVPVLAAAALTSPAQVSFVGAAHLRHKESNRIEALVAAMAEVGLVLEPLADGLRVPAGVQRARPGARWNSRGDHRLAMAGLVLAMTTEALVIEAPSVVAKSYPGLWEDAARLGFSVRLTGAG